MAIKETALNIVLRLRDLTKGALSKFKTEIDDTDKAAAKASDGGIKRLAKSVVGLVTAYATFSTVKSLITSVLATGDKFEKLGIQMTAVMGSIEGGEQATKWIKDFAKKTPLELEDVTTSFLKLKNFGLDPMDGSLQAIVDQNEKLGGGTERLTGITLALGQAFAKGKLQGEEIMQLVERGVPVYDLLAKVTGKNTAELQKMQEKGQLTRDVIKELIVEMGNAATGAAAANMETMSGVISNLKDRWTEWLGTVANSGALDGFKNLLADLNVKLDELTKNGSIAAWTQNVATGITAVFQGLTALGAGIVAAKDWVVLFGQAWLALKLAEGYASVAKLALGFRTELAGGLAASARAANLLKTALSGIVWLAVIQGVTDVAKATWEWVKAKQALQASQDAGKATEDEALRRIAQFREETGLAATSLDDLIAAQDAGTAIFDQANNKWIAGAEAVKKYKEGVGETKEAIVDLAEVAAADLESAIKAVNAEFQALTAAGEKGEEAVAKLLGQHDLTLPGDVQAVVAALLTLKATGELTEEQIKTGLGDALKNLTSGELANFAGAVKYAFDQGTLAAGDMQTFLDGALDASLKKLGLDMTSLRTGISQVGTDAIDAFGRVVRGVKETGIEGERASSTILAAYLNAFKQIESEVGRKNLLQGLQDAVAAGIISWTDYQKALDETKAKTDETAGAFTKLTDGIVKAKEKLDEVGVAGGAAGEKIKEGATGAGSAVYLLQTAIEGFTSQMAALSDGAKAAFEQLALGFDAPKDEAEALDDKLKAVQASLEELRFAGFRLVDATGLQAQLMKLDTEARNVEESFIAQKIAAHALFDEYDSGRTTAELYVLQAQRMVESSELLDDQDLGQLNQGIERARASMDALNESTRNTLATLQDELDQLQGNTDAIALRNYQERIADLQGQLDLAKALGQKESIEAAEAALRVAKQIGDIEEQNRIKARAEREARSREDAQAATTKAATDKANKSGESKSTSANQVIELKIGGKSVEVSTDNPSGLLELLATAGLRTN